MKNIKKILLLGAICGAINLLLVLPVGIAKLLYYKEGLQQSTIFVIFNIINEWCGFIFLFSFIALGKKYKITILIVSSILMIVFLFFSYIDEYLFNFEGKFFSAAMLSVLASLDIFMGYAFIKLSRKLGITAKLAGIFFILLGILFLWMMSGAFGVKVYIPIFTLLSIFLLPVLWRSFALITLIKGIKNLTTHSSGPESPAN